MGVGSAALAARFERVAPGNFDSFLVLVRAQHVELKSRFGVRQRRALRMLMRGDQFGYGWLIRVNDVPAGFVIVSLGFSVEYGGYDAFIDELYVEAAFRRLGLATRLLRVAERLCRGRVSGLCIWRSRAATARPTRSTGGPASGPMVSC